MVVLDVLSGELFTKTSESFVRPPRRLNTQVALNAKGAAT
jgi:hypothetical protein